MRPTDWRSDAAAVLAVLGEGERAERLSRDGIAAARAFGAPRALARSLRSAGRVIGGDEGLELLEEAVSLVEPSPARLEAAYSLADLGAELVEQRRRREGGRRCGSRSSWHRSAARRRSPGASGGTSEPAAAARRGSSSAAWTP